SFIGMILFDRYGRIPIMKIGTIGSIVGLLIASYGLYTHDTGYPMLYNNWLSGQMQNYGNLLNVGMNAASGQATAGQNYANNTGQ
ncbi:hypothetical protein MJM45_30425, partial [Salmonella enterica subsp. enterica serovar Kentucky]|nr:hypothetical protein [Salmonella enterica subsp. enterica serovar Kentucky]